MDIISSNNVYFQHCLDEIKKLERVNSTTDRMNFISAILRGCISIVTNFSTAKFFLSNLLPGGISDTFGYIIYGDGIVICVTVVKLLLHLAHNKKLCERAYNYNREIEKEQYLYGIITTADDWYFLRFNNKKNNNNNEYNTIGRYPINLNENNNNTLHADVKKIMEIIVTLLKDKIVLSVKMTSSSVY